MQTNREKIIEYISKSEFTTPHKLISDLGIGRTMIHRYLKELVSKGIIIKAGSGPKVFYSLAKDSVVGVKNSAETGLVSNSLIQENFTLITPTGNELIGVSGFTQWCNDRGYDIQQKISEYEKTFTEYEKLKTNHVIDASIKIKNTFTSEQRYLDHLYFLYPYSLPVFGKTKIAVWLFHGKQTQNTMLIHRVLETVVPELQRVILEKKYDAIAFVPPSVPREIQFMKLLQKRLQTSLPVIKIEKIKNKIIIQQKSLKELSDRVINADTTLVITGNGSYQKILIIDDFTGSGSTLNVLAKKMKNQEIATVVDGLTITGSMNGFEIVREI